MKLKVSLGNLIFLRSFLIRFKYLGIVTTGGGDKKAVEMKWVEARKAADAAVKQHQAHIIVSNEYKYIRITILKEDHMILLIKNKKEVI
jgi:hypothetical protein